MNRKALKSALLLGRILQSNRYNGVKIQRIKRHTEGSTKLKFAELRTPEFYLNTACRFPMEILDIAMGELYPGEREPRLMIRKQLMVQFGGLRCDGPRSHSPA